MILHLDRGVVTTHTNTIIIVTMKRKSEAASQRRSTRLAERLMSRHKQTLGTYVVDNIVR